MNGGQTSVLRRAVTRNARRLTVGTTLVSGHQACEALVPIMIGVLVDQAVATGNLARLALGVAALALLFFLLNTVYRLGARRLVDAITEEAHRLRLEVAAKVLDPRGARTGLSAGEVLSVSTSDADRTSYLLDYVPRFAGSLVAVIVSAVSLFLISVPLALAVLVATPLLLGGLQLIGPRITRRVADQQEQAGRATALATDLVTGLRPIRGIGAQDAAARRYHEVSRRSLDATLSAARVQGVYRAVSTTVSALLAGGVAILAGWFALTGRISVGQFITVIGLAQFLIEPLGALAGLPGSVADAKASAARINRVLTAEPARPHGDTTGVAPDARLELNGVRAGALEGLDLHLAPGELVGVVCSPAEADALIRLLAVDTVAESGTVTLGGTALADLADPSRHVLVEPHHADLFTGTLRSNVAIGGESPANLKAALKASAADEVVTAHPDGLDGAVTERGTGLSGGQRQRIALARALFAAPPVLVLHDPTTAVDAVTEHTVAHGVRELRHAPGSRSATLVLTGSPALLAQADRVVMLRDGAVSASGAHAELTASNEAYRAVVLR
ncbi:ABC transporter ATP-binding protein/permease [Actinoplanes bogorensis]|uniref:ABC transporter ATP-binding protein/permease n=1 Tax=Paractinoplanes bogorensis TaxID=1610840 RepID=A0ABS5YJS0_9ACTN|nr:ABC transporter ATP-binding protein [Actinoplanes bogorensis]MBU2663729.1 ABC transporter ATP-binding protein/permease [Actinoplanes bogorensis]